MTVINVKPNMNFGIWAEGGNFITPTSEKIEEGHVVEKPKAEIVNWIENRQDKMLQYINQRGIAEWDILTEYPVNSYTSRGGTLYKALSQNKDRDPTLFPLIWKLAFTTYEDYLTLLDELQKIKDQEGYLDLYVSKSDPIMTAPSQGVAYGFTGDSDTGLVKNSDGNPAIQKDGVVVASFDQLEQDNSVVTFSQLRSYLEFYKVGDVYITTNSGNPSSILGYGTWQRTAEGKAIVGMSTSTSDPLWTRFVNSTFGDYDHKLTTTEIPNHNHTFIGSISAGGGNGADMGIDGQGSQVATSSVGGDQAHNNTQPSMVFNVWLRTS
ncbi:MAG: hypothetical protein RR623_01365 [Bacilli bacterium]